MLARALRADSSSDLQRRAGYNRFKLDYTQEGSEFGEPLGNLLGVPNANQHETARAFPIFSPAGYTGAGHSRSLPIFRRENTFQYAGNLTWVKAAHTVKFGGDVRRRQLTEYQTNRGNGRFNFSPSITNNPENNSGGNSIASFLLGAPSLIEQDYLLAWVGIRGSSAATKTDFTAETRRTQRLSLGTHASSVLSVSNPPHAGCVRSLENAQKLFQKAKDFRVSSTDEHGSVFISGFIHTFGCGLR